jgi:glycosyltransferase involved in cell wall biosynthesis
LFRTARVLRESRPDEVWVMSPPLPAVALAFVYCARRRAALVVDIHSVGFFALRFRALRPLEIPILRRATVVLVTNDDLADTVRGWGCRPFVLTDPLPEPQSIPENEVDPTRVTVIATFSEDEPLDLLPAVASELNDLTFYVTSNPRGDTSHWPSNLVTTGFLEEQAYWRQLASSAVIMVLTRRPNTLLSGGYEALSLHRPLVLSDQRVLREYFGDSAVYAAADAAALANGVREALQRCGELSKQLCELAALRETEWQAKADELSRILERP